MFSRLLKQCFQSFHVYFAFSTFKVTNCSLGSVCSHYSILIDDFRTGEFSSWEEISDSSNHHGQSVSSFVKRPLKESSSAILFTLLIPCVHNAAFAGIVKPVKLDVTNTSHVILNIRGQGGYRGYEFLLRHNGDFGDAVPSYVTFFEAPTSEFVELKLPIDNFEPYQRGKLIPGAKSLNKSSITSLGILAYGGSHRPEKQSGVAALEIEWIKIE